MEIKGIVEIKTELIHPHPDNPRKDLGDITELAESIKKNGVMQNLTVIPMEGKAGEYITVIGHRRCAAAKLAGIEVLPCRIVEDMSYKEQVSTMLEENMQRNDLTIWEQSQGFQMMLDLGETEESIAEKTGFSRTTIRRRLSIGKLDQKMLKKREKEENFQISITDLYELERIKDIKKRNEILEKATGPRDLKWRVERAANEEKQAVNLKLYIEKFEEKGIKKAPKGIENEWYQSKWQQVEAYSLSKEPPKRIKVKTEGEELFYHERYETVYILKREKKGKKEETPEEKRRKEKERNKKKIHAILKHMTEERKLFIEEIIAGNIKPLEKEKEAAVIEALFEELLEEGTYISRDGLKEFFLGKRCYEVPKEEDEEAGKRVEKLNLCQKMLCLAAKKLREVELTDYNGSYIKSRGQRLEEFYAILKLYGFSIEDEEELKVLNGSSELYAEK